MRLIPTFCLVILFGVMTSSFAQADRLEEIGIFKNGVLHVTAIEAGKILTANPNIKILDVRTQTEYDRGHIAGATRVNYYSFSFRKNIAALDNSGTWLVHCAAGYRSYHALSLLKKAGFTSLIHMDDGFNAWKAADLPLETPQN